MAKVLVVMASFNRPKSVGRAIDSVKAQTISDWVLEVMDNSSPEMLPEMEEVYAEHMEGDERMRLHRTCVSNEDRYAKRWMVTVTNEALFALRAQGTEPYVVFTSDDVVMAPDKLEVLSSYLDSHPEAYSVTGIMHVVDDEGNVKMREGIYMRYGHAGGNVDWVQPMYRRTVLDEIGVLPDAIIRGSQPDIELFGKLYALAKKETGTEDPVSMYGVPLVLDVQNIRTKRSIWDPMWRGRAVRGEAME